MCKHDSGCNYPEGECSGACLEQAAMLDKIEKRLADECANYGMTLGEAGELRDKLDAAMLSGIPFDLKALLHAGHSSFYHDMVGLMLHFDKASGTMRNKFCPVNVTTKEQKK